VIESPFATVRLRQRVTKGAGSRTEGLLMAYKLLDMARARWRRLDGAHLLPLVRACDVFVDGFQREGRAEIRVVMLTAFSDSERVFAALKAGAVGYLLKKVSPDEIRTTVQRTATASPCSPAGRSAVPDVGRRYLQRSATSEWLSTATRGAKTNRRSR
jgi:DNA-binding NarL/FixJ family response regulator